MAEKPRFFNQKGQLLHELAGIQDTGGVEGSLDFRVEGADSGRRREGPPAFFGEADAVFAGDRAAHGEDAVEQIVKRRVVLFPGEGPIEIHHDVDVDIAITRMAKARDGKAMLFLQVLAEREDLFQFPSWNNDVLIELSKAGVTQRIGEFAAHLPELLTLLRAFRVFDETRAE